MKAVRWIVVLAVLGYAAWLAWPLIQGWVSPAPAALQVDAPGGLDTAEAASPPRIVLWTAAIGLYVLSAILFAGENVRAFLAYLLAFGSNLALFMLQQSPHMSTMARAAHQGAFDFDSRLVVIVGLSVIGFLMLTLGRGRARRRPGELAA